MKNSKKIAAFAATLFILLTGSISVFAAEESLDPMEIGRRNYEAAQAQLAQQEAKIKQDLEDFDNQTTADETASDRKETSSKLAFGLTVGAAGATFVLAKKKKTSDSAKELENAKSKTEVTEESVEIEATEAE